MYHEYFGLSEDPFSITPDPKYMFLTERHREALAHLVYGVTEGGGFVQLTGEVGTGKTILCRKLLMLLPDEINIALIFNPRQTPLELVASLCDELSIDYPSESSSIKLLVDRLNAYLLDNHSAGRRTVLVIDEAQNLSLDALQQLDLLTNLETASQKLLQIILVGQPELRDMLANPKLRQMAQHITARCHLTPLDAKETKAYIDHRLRVAGYQRRFFSLGAMSQMYRLSGGVPRLINVLCGRSMLAAYAKQRKSIDLRLLLQVARELEGRFEAPLRLRWVGALAGLLVVALSIGAWRQLEPVGLPIMADPFPVTMTPVSKSGETKPPQPVMFEGTGPAVLDSLVQTRAHPSVTVVSTPLVETKGLDIAALPTVTKARQAESPIPIQVEDQPGKGRDQPSDESQMTIASKAEPKSTLLESDRSAADRMSLESQVTEMAACEVTPKTLTQVIDDTLGSQGVRDDVAMAFEILFGYWQQEFPLQAEGSACEKAIRGGLQCLYGRGDWDDLRFHNRPAVIELLLDNGRRYHVVVASMLENQITLDLGQQRVEASPVELEPLWSGSYIVLWRPPPLENEYLRQGSQGADVHWLSRMLEQVDGISTVQPDDPNLASFDWQLTKRVLAFQRSVGLPEDGVVGKQTLIKLKAGIEEPGVPALDSVLARISQETESAVTKR